jgi:hypothetical protein
MPPEWRSVADWPDQVLCMMVDDCSWQTTIAQAIKEAERIRTESDDDPRP